LNSVAYRFGLGPILDVWWEARIRDVQPVRQVHDLGIVLLERLRSDSSLVTHGTVSLRDKWEFGLEIVAFQYLPMFLGETQESQEQEGQMHVIAAKLQGFF
jgi:hypothetical protein